MPDYTLHDLYRWCSIPYTDLPDHPERKIPFRLCADSNEMGQMMAHELVDLIALNNQQGKTTRAILPCGPSCWYQPFTGLVNRLGVSLRDLVVFHMDECLDWQGRELPRRHPYSFRGFMERHFYDPVRPELQVEDINRVWLTAENISQVRRRIEEASIEIAYGGWGQDGHVAYNQSRRQPFSQLSVDDLRNSTIRLQENNPDTILALAQRTLGMAYQFIPPMSVTLGMREVLSAQKIRLFSDTGAWKQTALRLALFGPLTSEYPITLLQQHPDALLTATVETARHPISEHPEWEFGEVRFFEQIDHPVVKGMTVE
jgi:glucosamine-6-phosphate deaminase